MRAVWYERQGPAGDVLRVGEFPDLVAAPGEVRVRVRFSGISPGDTKKRRGWLGSAMPYPKVIPHSDGAGIIDMIGEGVDASRIGQRVWVYGAQSYRPWGTAAEYVTVPAAQAVALPEAVPDEVGACLGVPGITAHHAVFADGPVRDQVVLVHGALGAVSSLAAQLALRGGAKVIVTVRHTDDLGSLPERLRAQAVALERDPVEQIGRFAPHGVDRIIEVDFSGNSDLDATVVRNGAVIAAYASRDDRPDFPFWPMLFDNVTIRLLGSDDFPDTAKQRAATDLTAAASAGELEIAIRTPFPLNETPQAHDQVDTDNRLRVLIDIEGGSGSH